ncbi:flippase [Bradyrhizobium sp. sBnM-33]|uniref:flippase n=1 Tax=Bradyrhizobium sp. sBnM-33 TaxID=2831780 RepID=UPI001BCD4E9D|nr:flippase [Bradyrhizobium sp. sBnM-33]WOH53661.1 flippase [Bradyrhizobium sp. sBnM-33]
MSESYLKRNVVYNIIGASIPTLVAVLTIPIYLRVIGEARYGVLSLIWLVFGYFGLFDFGLSRATAHRLSMLRSSGIKTRASIFYTAACLNVATGLSVAGIFYLVAVPILNITISKHTSLYGEVFASLPWIAIFFPIALLNGVLVGCMEANERFLQLNIQQVVGAILLQCLPLAFVYWLGSNLEVAVLGAIAARTFAIAWLAFECIRWAFAAGWPQVDRSHIKELVRYGGWITVTNSVSPVLTSIDQFVIGLLLGARAVAHYSIPFSLAGKALIVPAALTRALFPRLCYSTTIEAQELSHRSLIILSATMALICVPAILLTKLALGMWVGEDFALESHLVAEILLIGVWINGLALIPFTLLQAQNRPDLVAKLHALEVIPFVLLLSLFIKIFGLPGAAMAWCLRVTADGVLMFLAAGFKGAGLKELGAPALAVIAALLIAELIRPDIGAALAWALAILSCLSAWMLSRRDQVLISYVRPIISRIVNLIF